ncbi:MAG TPA: hypothetical protein VF469_14835 [Kofleriaceae bacterium]
MKHKIGKVLAALMLSSGMVGAAATAHAGGFTMVPAAAGSPKYSEMIYNVGQNGIVFPNYSNNLIWIIPAPNNTGMSGGSAYIDYGDCSAWCSGGGFAIDWAGNYEAVTNIVQFNSSTPTSQLVTFGTGFQKTSYTYVTYWMGLGSTGQVNGIEYYQQ